MLESISHVLSPILRCNKDAAEVKDSADPIQNAAPPCITDLNYCTSVTDGEEENHHTCGVPEHFGVRPGFQSPCGLYRAHAFKETHLLQSVHLCDDRRGSENDNHFACGMPEHQGVRPCHSLSGQQHGLDFSSFLTTVYLICCHCKILRVRVLLVL